ncbi:hypothetical protein F7725_001017 [Dissostichus mawsoni]|uniref:C-type lectin domain-containing protein n=1 Tax=Dissostichus mawsoni TaxID=36200 RepID=A0A7J5ZG15_DISMA|nr:hypothetical protein F7725_001017 [Dissostichus mawsoni]
MASCLHFIVVLCLTIGLWSGANKTHAMSHVRPALLDGLCLKITVTCTSMLLSGLHCPWWKLASIPNGGYKFIRKIVNTATNANNPTWIGGNDLAKEGVWMWSDGTKFVAKNWAPGQPDNALGQEHCLMMNYQGMH